MGVKSLLFDRPCRSAIATDAKTRRRRRDHDLGPGWMCTYLMNVAIDIDSRPPSYAGVSRSRNPADVDVNQKHGTIARRRHGTNPKRRPNQLAVDDRRSCVPPVAAGYGVKTRQASLRTVTINAPEMCVIGSNKDVVSNWYAA
jgi:hypothetical protein